MVFDWNDEELANIIWGDTGQSDEHIVPYPDGSENKSLGLYPDHNKEWDKDGAHVKLTEQKKSTASNDSNGVKQGLDSQCTTYDFSPSNNPKADINTMCNERLNRATGISNNGSSRSDEKPQPSEGFELREQPEDKEGIDLVRYDWANIGSFDDLDRIFSRNDQMFGHVSIGNPDESRSSSKNISSSPEMSVSLSLDSPSPGFGALGTKPDHYETKAEHMLDQYWPPLGFQKMNNYSRHSTVGAKGNMNNFETIVGKSQPTAKSKVKRQRKLLKSQKILPLKGEVTKLQNFYGSCSSYGSQGQQYDNQIAPDMGQPSSSIIYQQNKFRESESSPYKILANPSSYEASTSKTNLVNNRLNSARKILNMTPEEKIAKLRSRQKMRAMVAIQKQQQQFSHQPSSNVNCISPRCDDLVRRREINGSLSVLPSFNKHSPMEQNSSNFLHMNVDKYSIEDSVVHKLQDVVNKLGDQIRICIRDSLFRLAQSSIQRQHGSDTCITNRSSMDELDDIVKEGTNNHKRFVSMSNVETETNPIDRTVAHLLFHRPLELSDKLPVLEPPFPTNLPCEAYERDSSVQIPCLLTEADRSTSPYPETSDYASNHEIRDDCEAIEVEASQ